MTLGAHLLKGFNNIVCSALRWIYIYFLLNAITFQNNKKFKVLICLLKNEQIPGNEKCKDFNVEKTGVNKLTENTPEA